MKVTGHTRNVAITQAYADLMDAISEWEDKHPDLTLTEKLSVLHKLSVDSVGRGLWVLIKNEREEN